MDKIVEIVSKEKDEASKNYFTNLLRRSKETPSGGGDTADPTAKPAKALSPIEQLFHQHMKRSLGAYEEYYQVSLRWIDNPQLITPKQRI